MTKKPCDLELSKSLQSESEFARGQLLFKLGAYFRAQRLALGLDENYVVETLELGSRQTLLDYEACRVEIPLEDVCGLTNLLNLAPEDVMDLIHGLSALGTV